MESIGTHHRGRAALHGGGRHIDRAHCGERRVECGVGVERGGGVGLPFCQRTQHNTAVYESLLDIRAKLVARIGRLACIRIARMKCGRITGGASRNGTDGSDGGKDRGDKHRRMAVGTRAHDLLSILYNVTRIHSTLLWIFSKMPENILLD